MRGTLFETSASRYDNLAVLCDRHLDARAALGVDQLDGLRHRVRHIPSRAPWFRSAGVQPEKAARKILGVGCNESLGKRKDTLRAKSFSR